MISNNLQVTVICLTYGDHKRLTEEAIQSVLLQNYPYVHFMLCNTHIDPVVINTKHQNITIFNIKDVFTTLRAKYLYMLKKITTPFWCVLDDDDIILPHFISVLVRSFKKQQVAISSEEKLLRIGYNHHYFMNSNKITKCNATWTSYIYEKPNNFLLNYLQNSLNTDKKVNGFDQILFNWKNWNTLDSIKEKICGYIYRWGTGSFHISGSGGHKEVYDINRKKVSTNRIKESFQPHWDIDYNKKILEWENL